MSDDMEFGYEVVKFGPPPGRYRLRFLGVEPIKRKEGEPPKIGKDGKPMQDAMSWMFEVADGEHVGVKVDRWTSRKATGANMCGRFMVANSGVPFEAGRRVNLRDYIGRLYDADVVKRKGKDDATCVSDTRITPVTEAVREYFIQRGNNPPDRKSRDELVSLLTGGSNLAGYRVCEVGGSVWKDAGDLAGTVGANGEVPF
jgi:hypothetical protein